MTATWNDINLKRCPLEQYSPWLLPRDSQISSIPHWNRRNNVHYKTNRHPRFSMYIPRNRPNILTWNIPSWRTVEYVRVRLIIPPTGEVRPPRFRNRQKRICSSTCVICVKQDLCAKPETVKVSQLKGQSIKRSVGQKVSRSKGQSVKRSVAWNNVDLKRNRLQITSNPTTHYI
jgi:hypothetical protein